MILAAIGLVLLVTVVPTARSVMAQRARITELQSQISQQQRDVEALKAEQEKWQDPAYVEQQARQRLKFVKPGDRSYTVIDPAEASRPAVTGASVAAPRSSGDAPWYGQVWESMRLADKPTSGMLPVSERR